MPVFAQVLPAASLAASNDSTAGFARFQSNILPILKEYCFDCHGDGMNKGKVAFDEFKTQDELLARKDLWMAALKNVRAGLMPPEKKPRPSEEQKRTLAEWIKRDAFGIDPNDPDPGRVTVRRLNRTEYRNTIRDLTGFDFKVEEELPPDDTGFGFDNIGDVLSLSPLLLEKYMQAAETIAASAVPRVTRVVAEKNLPGASFRKSEGKGSGERLSFYEAAKVGNSFSAPHAGSYRLLLELEVLGQFDFDPGKCQVLFKTGDHELLKKEFGWQNGKKFKFDFDQHWEAGEHPLSLELVPLTPVDQKKNSLDLRILSVRVQGPLEEKHWVRPANFELFFSKDPPTSAAKRRDYAREVLGRFAKRAYRRPVDGPTVERLVSIAQSVYTQPGKRFEDGIAQAIVPVLASPRFLFRVEDTEPSNRRPKQPQAARSDAKLTSAASSPSPSGRGSNVARSKAKESTSEDRTSGQTLSLSLGERAGVRGNGPSESSGASQLVASVSPTHLFIDDYALASRLSYFLWSTMPDDELFRLADRGTLRQNLDAQVKRMLADRRSRALIENFVGQWLQVRDVEGIDINAFVVLARDRGEERDFARRRQRFQELIGIPEEKRTPEQKAELQEMIEQRRRRQGNRRNVELDRELRRALREETEHYFGYVVREDRSVLELLDSDYTFLNERLARHYDLTNLNLAGPEFHRVTLPADGPRGGVLTHGAVLIVTSNPTRTSPVKRGLFILDNILGTPPPPPPADIPLLEDSEKELGDRKPTLRETLAVHRGKPLCSSCHNRMDPLGLALENFNALGMWRDKERGQPIDSSGKLITGEPFQDIRQVRHVLATTHHLEFYRCLTEKLLTYALGRGLEPYDVETVDRIVERLEQQNGRFSALLLGIVESAPFQKRRNQSAPDSPEPPKSGEQRAELKSSP